MMCGVYASYRFVCVYIDCWVKIQEYFIYWLFSHNYNISKRKNICSIKYFCYFYFCSYWYYFVVVIVVVAVFGCCLTFFTIEMEHITIYSQWIITQSQHNTKCAFHYICSPHCPHCLQEFYWVLYTTVVARNTGWKN